MTKNAETQVAIVGGGPVGLALAIELGLRGVACVLVEQHQGHPRVPRMSGVSSRNMEFCRRWGIADKVRDAAWSSTHPSDFVYVESMTGRELARLKIPSYREREGRIDYSPEGPATCPQIYFDPLLAEKARSVEGVTLQYGTRLEAFEQNGAGVRGHLVDTRSDEPWTVSARYLVGCDGAGGTVRRDLGIALDGQGTIARSVNIFFRSPEFMQMHDKGWARFLPLLRRGGVLGRGDRNRTARNCGACRFSTIPRPTSPVDAICGSSRGATSTTRSSTCPPGNGGISSRAPIAAGGC